MGLTTAIFKSNLKQGFLLPIAVWLTASRALTLEAVLPTYEGTNII